MINKLLQFFTFFLFFSFSFSSSAQDQLTVTAPEALAGVYDVNISFFGTGDAGTDGVSGPIMLSTSPNNEACDPFTDDMTGKIAMIDRGSCNFSSKVYNAQVQGAIAVIICNNVAGSIRMLGGDFADQVNVPNVMMTLDDCNTLKMDLDNVQATLEYVETAEAVSTFWGANGEGSFNDGTLGDWTANGLGDNPDENWTVRRAAPGQALDAVGENIVTFFDVPLSPSYHQGYVAFEAQLYQGEDAPGPPYPYKGAELISPIIDCSSCVNAGVEAYQYFVRLNTGFNSDDGRLLSGASIVYSLDGGTTYADTVSVNLDVASATATPAADKFKVFIPELDGQSNVRLKFLFELDYYVWAIDEIKVIQLENNNLSLINDFYGLPSAISMPASQITPFQFVTDIRNLGALDQPNTEVEVSIDGPDGYNFTTSLDYGTLPSLTSAIDAINPEPFTPPNTVGSYTGRYTVQSDSTEFDNTDNTLEFSFNITDSLYAYEDGFTVGLRPPTGWYNGNPVSWAWGNAFYFPNGSDVKINNIEVGVANPADRAGENVNVILYKWVNNGDTLIQANERELVAFAELELSAGDAPNTLFKVPLESAYGAPGDPIILEDDATYLLMTEFSTSAATADDYLVLNGNDTRNYFGTIWLSQQLGTPRYIPVVGVPINGDNLADIPYSVWVDNTINRSFGLDVVPVNRLYVIDKDATSTEELNIVKNFTVSPNPADEFININLDLDESVENMFIQLSDIRGVIVKEIIRNNLASIQENINVSQLMAGNYFVTIATEKGTTTKKIIIK